MIGQSGHPGNEAGTYVQSLLPIQNDPPPPTIDIAMCNDAVPSHIQDTNTPTPPPLPNSPPASDNPILQLWSHSLTTLSPEEFTAFTYRQIDDNLPSCPDANGFHPGLNPSQVEHFCQGCWQSSWDIGLCMTGIFRIHNIDPTPVYLSQPDIEAILKFGNPPAAWRRHFGPDRAYTGPLDLPCLLGVWHNGSDHFVVFYLCPKYWTIIDSLGTPPPHQKTHAWQRSESHQCDVHRQRPHASPHA